MTPAIKELIKYKCYYKIYKFEHDKNCINYGQEAVYKLKITSNQIFKTLVVELSIKNLIICIIPVFSKLNLKKVANLFKAKKASIASKNDAQNATGYLIGGISPFGQKKNLETIIDKTAFDCETIFLSAGVKED